MIGRLRGSVDEIGEDWAIIDVNGVGYQISGAPRLLAALTVGAEARLAIDTVMREDGVKLYAFADDSEKRAFKALQAVQGVGARHALAVLNVLTPGQLADAAALEDWAAVARAHGVGKKIAQRIVAELKGSGALAAPTGAALRVAVSNDAPAAPPSGDPAKADVVSALTNLGYGEADALRAAAAARAEFDAAPDVGAWIKAALKQASAA